MRSQGYTLVEVMVAMSIFGIILGGMLPMFLAHMKANSFGEQRSEAVSAAVQVLDVLRLEDPVNMPLSGSTDPVDVQIGDRAYQVVTTYCANDTYCESGNSRHLHIAVSYHGQPVYSVETVFTQLR